ncbi:hypothetical protein DSC45_34665 [Streptomyces sp. YIM 130001]|nr:hypothetical protein DSC45_34665 [Streptomyces sp. YIM 130001]
MPAGAWFDDDPAVGLDNRPGWSGITGVLSAGIIRGVVVGARSHVATDTAQFTALKVLIRDRGGFLATIDTVAVHPDHQHQGHGFATRPLPVR